MNQSTKETPADILPKLQIDDTYSILYDPNNNDRPVAIYRHDGFFMHFDAGDHPNWALALYYFALERSNPEDINNG